ncbi:MAG: prohibitin family protein [Deltaproteobacteria bacterium]|nr:prohibitin family protein [Deltaproteobacteria bacterium]
MPNMKMVGYLTGGILLLLIALSANPFVMIGAGERGVVMQLGAVQEKVLEEGLHFRVPFVQRVVVIDVRTQKMQVNAPSYSRDLQNVDTVIALNFHVDPTRVNKLWQEIGRDFEGRIIHPAIQESVKAATAQFTAAELVEKRPMVKDEIKSILQERLGGRYLLVDDFSIVDFKFSESYEKAIEEKQVAQQQALKAENDLRRIQVEAEQRVATAKAEAEAIRITAEALRQNPDLIQLEAVKKWDGKMPQFAGGGSMPFINLPTGR